MPLEERDAALRLMLSVGVGLVGLGLAYRYLGRWRKKRPVLAVDFDEVCVGYLPAFIEFSNATHATSLRIQDFHSYMFWKVPGCKLDSRENATKRVYEFHASPFFDKIKPLDGAYDALRKLKDKYELHIVTSRQNDIQMQTHACIDRYFPEIFVGVHFGNHFGISGKKTSKPDMCKTIGAAALLDDSLDYARECADSHIPAYVFGDYGWNQSDEKLSPLIHRVKNWKAVTDALLDSDI